MKTVTLHYRVTRDAPACAICGAELTRRASRWWLLNTWTADRTHYRETQTSHPSETARPCGDLVAALSRAPGATS